MKLLVAFGKWLVAGLLVTSSVAYCQLARVGSVDQAVAPFLDDKTDIVVAVNVTQVDVDAIEQWLVGQVKAARVDEADSILRAVKRWADESRPIVSKLRQAGAKRIYAVAPYDEVFASEHPGLVIVPLEDGVDGTIIARIIEEADRAPEKRHTESDTDRQSEFSVAILGKNVIAGSPTAVAAAKKKRAVARPELMQALASGGSATVRVAIAGAVLRHWGVGKSAALEVSWAALAFSPPAQGFAAAIVQCDTPQSARDAAGALNAFIAKFNTDAQTQPAASDATPAAITAHVQGSRAVIRLNGKAMESALGPLVGRIQALQEFLSRMNDTRGDTRPTSKSSNESESDRKPIDWASPHLGCCSVRCPSVFLKIGTSFALPLTTHAWCCWDRRPNGMRAYKRVCYDVLCRFGRKRE